MNPPDQEINDIYDYMVIYHLKELSKKLKFFFDSGAGISVISEELFPEMKSEKSHKVYGIGGWEYAGDAIECEILVSSSWKTKHSLKPMHIPDKNGFLYLGSL